MTKQEAKELSLEVWRYLAEHPKISRKQNLPKEILNKVRLCIHLCPLCDLFKDNSHYGCSGCPLENCQGESYYNTWFYAGSDNKKRKENAEKIVEAIEAWKPEGTK